MKNFIHKTESLRPVGST